ncbi:HEAT repeat domain-containing protein [Deinococcus fonticola]|uniref:HEAT repeat domain-containing protein n=1 Tax=Deinococcus fonticola TaxID=2528713 RepID=UPI001074B1ED|nr:HEAT repeat domain-containing protein [Deinococcus fonticola]
MSKNITVLLRLSDIVFTDHSRYHLEYFDEIEADYDDIYIEYGITNINFVEIIDGNGIFNVEYDSLGRQIESRSLTLKLEQIEQIAGITIEKSVLEIITENDRLEISAEFQKSYSRSIKTSNGIKKLRCKINYTSMEANPAFAALKFGLIKDDPELLRAIIEGGFLEDLIYLIRNEYTQYNNILSDISQHSIKIRFSDTSNLKDLANSNNVVAKEFIALSYLTPSDILDILALDSMPKIRQLVAENINTSDESLKILSKDRLTAVVKAARKTKIKKNVLAFYYKISSIDDLNCYKYMSSKYIFDSDDSMLINYILRVNCDKKIPKEFFSDKNKYIKLICATNKDSPEEILRRLASGGNKEVKLAGINNPNMPLDIFAQLAKDKNIDVRRAVARSSRTPLDVFVQLAEDEDGYVRQFIAENPNTPLDLLAQLAEDEDVDVRRAVARSSRTPLDVLAQVVEDEDSVVRWAVARNPKTPLDLLNQLVEDEDSDVRLAVLSNPNLPLDTLAQVVEDEDLELTA